MQECKEISLKYLFFTFLKIGSISWGGFMALIAVMKKQLVDKDKVINEKVVLDGISLASVLPGAVAVNVATYIGYQLRGIKGGLFCLVATILPAFLMILCLGTIYSTFGELPFFNKFFLGILPAISAVILSVAIGMAQKQIKDYKQVIMCLLAGICLLTIHTFYATLFVIISSAIAGYLFYRVPETNIGREGSNANPVNYRKLLLYAVIPFLPILILFIAIWVFGLDKFDWYNINRTIFLTFSGMSLTLFGGGYVIVPAMQSVIVEGFHWMTTKEFSDAIAMGQITPGPVIITATFIGFKVAGYLGALVATLAIFIPPGILIIISSVFLKRVKDSEFVTAIFLGMRPAIIGMIFSAAITIGKGAELTWPSALIILLTFVLLVKYKVNVAWMIPLAGIAGILLF